MDAPETLTERMCLAGTGGVQLSLLKWHAPGSATGGPPAPPPLLLHHGLASSAGFWGPVARRLAAGGPAGPPREVLALDARGHGESARPEDGYDFATVTADLHAVLRGLGWEGSTSRPHPVLVGHSWGGNVIVEYAARHPEVPAAIVLVDGGFIELQPDMDWADTERELAPPLRPPTTWDQFVARAPQRWPELEWNAEIQAAVRHNFEDLPDGTIRVRLARDRHMRILRALWEQRPSRLFGSVRCPVLVLPTRRATDDEQERRLVERRERAVASLEATLRGSGTPVEVYWFEDSVHDVPLQRPALVAERIGEFVAGLTVPAGAAGPAGPAGPA